MLEEENHIPEEKVQATLKVAALAAREDLEILQTDPARGQGLLQQYIKAKENAPEALAEFLNKYGLEEGTPVHKVHFLRRRWLRYAAAAILILAIGSGIYYFNSQSFKSQKSNESPFRQKTQAYIPPGINKAIWTLSNGKQIELDSTVLDMTVAKTNDVVGYNELRTPRGGQYQLILPDGSKVWLNAASSIRYPTVFNGKERRVEVAGEAYFEIEKNAYQPFKVYSGEQQIEVLGTSFNINAYDSEPTQKTTLISGSIKVSANNQTAILKPGQQASISITKIKQITVQTTNIEQDLAWKNGSFNFEALSLQEAMRQLERWYDIKVVYEKGIPNIRFFGEISRNVPLSDLLEGLKESELKFRMEENKTLVILPR